MESLNKSSRFSLSFLFIRALDMDEYDKFVKHVALWERLFILLVGYLRLAFDKLHNWMGRFSPSSFDLIAYTLSCDQKNILTLVFYLNWFPYILV